MFTEHKEFVEGVRQSLRNFKTRIAESETLDPRWQAFKPELQAEQREKQRADVLKALRMDLPKQKKAAAEKLAGARKDWMREVYPSTYGGPLQKEEGRYADWRAAKFLSVSLEAHIRELNGILDLDPEGEYASRLSDWLRVRPVSPGEAQKHGVDLALALQRYESLRGFKEWRATEELYKKLDADFTEAERMLEVPQGKEGVRDLRTFQVN